MNPESATKNENQSSRLTRIKRRQKNDLNFELAVRQSKMSYDRESRK